jgi:hypothetical protein
MKPIQYRNSNPMIWVFPIALGFACILGTIFLSVYFKNHFIARHQLLNPPREDFETINEIREVETKIFLLGGRISQEKSYAEIDKHFSGKVNQSKIDAIQKMETDRERLLIKKEELLKKKEENRGKPTGDWYIDNDIESLIETLLYFGLLTGILAYVTFLMRDPKKPYGLTSFEMRSIAFLLTAISGSLFGFFVYLWYISITY